MGSAAKFSNLSSRIRPAVVVGIIAWSSACAATAPVPVQADSSFVLPDYVRQVVTGAPADSVVLRVSLCTIEGDGRIDTQAFIIVEEIKWPLPGPRYRVAFEGEPAVSADEDEDGSWLLAAVRIPGGYLNQARREIAPPPPAAGMRAGEIGGHWLRPFEFVAWLGPHKFVVDDGRGRFVIERMGPGRYELASVTRWR